ncbi:MAG TPA: alpha/beta hydrolase [Rhizomicrobium sp.]|jgi:acetyl esterase/lipase
MSNRSDSNSDNAGDITLADPAGFVHPEYRPWIELIKLSATAPHPSLENIAERRSTPSPLMRAPLDAPAYTTQAIPGANGMPDVVLYIVNAGDKGAPRPAILHTHGGGFVFGTAQSFLANLQEIAAALDCVIVSVDYRLAPETPFPGSLEDNYAGLKWLYAHADELGADPKRIVVMGESAGGGHAAMLAIAARDRGEVPVIYQALVYPMLDDRTGTTQMPPPHIGAFIWRRGDNAFGWTSLLGVPAGSENVPHGAVPARVENLHGLPPAFIGVGSLDLFLEEDIEYARRLTAAGVPIELHVYPGCPHGFDFLQTNVAMQFKAALLNALRSAFEHAGK